MTILREVEALYEITRRNFTAWKGEFGSAYAGYSILYGQPLLNAPVIFVGFQPGGATGDDQDKAPDVCDYAVADYRLARELRRIFGADFLRACTGMNVVFARAANKASYYALPASLTETIDSFCVAEARNLIDRLKPRRLVAIGLQTADLLGSLETDVLSTFSRRVMRTGEILGIPSVAVMHLTGARLRSAERALITDYLRAFVGLPALASEGA